MHIARLSLYAVPIDVGMELTRYVTSQSINPPLDIVVVKLETKCGLVGWGEVCSAPPYYLPELSAGARAGICYVAPLVLGRAPREAARIMHDIAAALRGHGNAKTALEMALWDLAAKAQRAPLVDLWGGRISDRLPVLNVVRIGTREEMLAQLEAQRGQGYSRFQIKVGGGEAHEDIETIRMVEEMAQPHERFWYDSNRAWSVDDALRVIRATAATNPMMENPCETYEMCRTVARRTGARLMLDECLDSPQMFLRAAQDGVMDVASLKTSCIGGLQATRQAMAMAHALHIPLRIEDYAGSGILLACVAHLAHTLPRKLVFGLYDYVSADLPLVKNPLQVKNGEIQLPDNPAPGLGVEVDEAQLGEPLTALEA